MWTSGADFPLPPGEGRRGGEHVNGLDAHEHVFTGIEPVQPLPTPGPSLVREGSRLFSEAPAARAEPAVEPVPGFPLGVARGQVAATYIVAEAEDGLVIVDQHAAHERLVLERMRAAREGGAVARQALL